MASTCSMPVGLGTACRKALSSDDDPQSAVPVQAPVGRPDRREQAAAARSARWWRATCSAAASTGRSCRSIRSTRAIEGVLTYPDVASLPLMPDLAVIATPPETVPGIIAELAGRGTKAAVVITAGFGGRRGSGRRPAPGDARCRAAASAAHRRAQLPRHHRAGHRPERQLCAASIRCRGTSPSSPVGRDRDRGARLGDVARHRLLAPGLARRHGRCRLRRHARLPGHRSRRPGRSCSTSRSITSARKFMSAARAAARIKPVIVVKAGRHAEGARAAASHTGALAGADAVYDAAFRRAGMLRVRRLEELFDAVRDAGAAQPTARRPARDPDQRRRRRRAGDRRSDRSRRQARRAGAGDDRRASIAVLPATWSHGNPVDIIGDAPAQRYAAALEVAARRIQGVDARPGPQLPDRGHLAPKTRRRPWPRWSPSASSRAVLTSWLGERAARARRGGCSPSAGIPTYDTPEDGGRRASCTWSTTGATRSC